ncbi:MAG: M23 family metallopeptidase [Ruthenibacterium sp.]
MHNKNNSRQFWQGKGFYVALAVVILGSALASYLAISAMMQRLGAKQDTPQTSIGGQEDIPWNEPITEAEEKKSGVPVTSSVSSGAQKESASQSSPCAQSKKSGEPDALQTARAGSFVWPVQGSILQAYSGDELIFNETMQDWRTHNGTDIAAAAGDAVKAPTAATVSAVAQDGQWGGVVELTAGDVTVRVCGLSGISVKQGDTVKQGAELGHMGAVPAEIAAAPHLHLEVTAGGKPVDPQSYFAD